MSNKYDIPYYDNNCYPKNVSDMFMLVILLVVMGLVGMIATSSDEFSKAKETNPEESLDITTTTLK